MILKEIENYKKQCEEDGIDDTLVYYVNSVKADEFYNQTHHWTGKVIEDFIPSNKLEEYVHEVCGMLLGMYKGVLVVRERY